MISDEELKGFDSLSSERVFITAKALKEMATELLQLREEKRKDNDTLAQLKNLKERRRGGEVPEPDLLGIALDLAIEHLTPNEDVPATVISVSQLMAELLGAYHLFECDDDTIGEYEAFIDSWNELHPLDRAALCYNVKKYLKEQSNGRVIISD